MINKLHEPIRNDYSDLFEKLISGEISTAEARAIHKDLNKRMKTAAGEISDIAMIQHKELNLVARELSKPSKKKRGPTRSHDQAK